MAFGLPCFPLTKVTGSEPSAEEGVGAGVGGMVREEDGAEVGMEMGPGM